MEKVIYTVCVNNYLPDLCKVTLPSIQAYAERIGARFQLITERKFPEFPPTYEKMQIHSLGEHNIWNILIDADIVIDNKMPDVTEIVHPSNVASYMQYQADLLFGADQYFVRDSRRIGVCTNFVVTHLMTHDVWTPLEFGWDIAQTKTKRAHIIDEYCVSRNLAKFGLKICGLDPNDPPAHFLHLDATASNEKEMIEKAVRFLETHNAT